MAERMFSVAFLRFQFDFSGTIFAYLLIPTVMQLGFFSASFSLLPLSLKDAISLLNRLQMTWVKQVSTFPKWGGDGRRSSPPLKGGRGHQATGGHPSNFIPSVGRASTEVLRWIP